MNELLQKLALFILGLVLLINYSSGSLTVVSFVMAVSFVGLQTYFEEKRTVSAILGVLYLCLCLWEFPFVFFLPVLLYGLFQSRLWIMAAFGMIILLFYFNGQPLFVLLLFVFSGVSLLFQWQAAESRRLSNQLKIIRDSSMELTMALKNKNKYLMEKQDYEIHLAMLKERNRIAREIHDNVGHMLSRSILQTGAMTAVNKSEELREPLSNLKNTLADAMDSIRRSVHDLHDESVDLHSQILKIIEGLSSYEVQFDYDISEQTPAGMKYCFIAVVKEAVSNIIKHSSATKIYIVVREHPAFYQLLIQDNGKGSHTGVSEGMGLSGMEDRVNSLGGTFHVSSGNGFRIFISIQKNTN